MATDPNTSQTLALAGVLQTAYLVDQIARTGTAPAESVNPSLNSLFAFDANSTEAVYGGIHGVKLGLQVLTDILNGSKRQQYSTIIRYTLGMLYLQKKLSANDELLNIMRSRLEHASLNAEHFSDNPASTTKSIAAIYQDTLSTFKFRIQVSGSMQQLQNSQNADTIRALLLAGIRSAVLWRQTGGRRWKLLLNRRQLLNSARELLATL
ncbi:high frequency lysogenization protein HflD [Oceanicoccus sagamiensis]|uniref:High frequency lysogenization protein HflD homolog n=1 Tax=Oceanicoccus sagamiensis TaxID=716816 RepID=A0A1X9NHB4_9GAMM|nr:high frequency lysogenization protein HflD [Oceanicoccus sagamiensis]ARN75792.1 lysogenization regulator HflD [Oceanicoccus sagamiensis]